MTAFASLQVHLILALPLFVVVVGVDSRWLLTSLHRHYQAQLGSADRQEAARSEAEEERMPLAAGLGQDDWTSTPQNYLEKIFQIPFAIRPMDRKGFRELLGQVLGHQRSDDTQGERTDPSGRDVSTETVPQQPPPTGHQPSGPEGLGGVTPPAPVQEQAAQDKGTEERTAPNGRAHDPGLGEPVAMNPQGLRVTGQELEFMAGLARMVQTPRAAKRLLNTYWLIRAGLDEADLGEFVHNGGASGQYQVALILLAVLIGFPELAGTLFNDLLTSRAASWADFLGEERAKLHERTTARRPNPPDLQGTLPRQSSAVLSAPTGQPPARPQVPLSELGAGEQDEPTADRLPASSRALRGNRHPAGSQLGDEQAEPERLLLDQLEELTPSSPPVPLELYQEWARRVTRYSFQTVRLAGEPAAESPHQSRLDRART
jgi:hypothetical protein